MYGLPTGTNIPYGSPGFPGWVYELAKAFGITASTYPGHQESERAESGFAANPHRLNRGIDWTGTTAELQKFAEYLLTIKGSLEQVIWENPDTGRRIGVARRRRRERHRLWWRRWRFGRVVSVWLCGNGRQRAAAERR